MWLSKSIGTGISFVDFQSILWKPLFSFLQYIANEEEVSVVLRRLVRLDCASLYTELISRPIDSLFYQSNV